MEKKVLRRSLVSSEYSRVERKKEELSFFSFFFELRKFFYFFVSGLDLDLRDLRAKSRKKVKAAAAAEKVSIFLSKPTERRRPK